MEFETLGVVHKAEAVWILNIGTLFNFVVRVMGVYGVGFFLATYNMLWRSRRCGMP